VSMLNVLKETADAFTASWEHAGSRKD
jgi:hypothetical protein